MKRKTHTDVRPILRRLDEVSGAGIMQCKFHKETGALLLSCSLSMSSNSKLRFKITYMQLILFWITLRT